MKRKKVGSRGIMPKRVARATWEKQKKRYYAKTRKTAFRSYDRWSDEDRDLILYSDYTDRELSKRLGRSMFAIQIQRHRLKTHKYQIKGKE